MIRVAMGGCAACLFVVMLGAQITVAQSASPAPAAPQTTDTRPPRPTPPTRDPHTPGYVEAKELPDGQVPPPDADGNFIIGPTHPRAPEMDVREGVPQGTLYEFTMESKDSKYYPGVAREPNTYGTPDPENPAKMMVTTNHPAPYTRHVGVYVPKQYVPGTEAPFIIGADGIDRTVPVALDNLIVEHKVPVMIAISFGNGGGDGRGSVW